MAELVGVFEIPVGPTPTGPLADMSTQLGDNTAPQASGEALAKSDIGGALSSSAPYPGRELPVYGAIEPGFGADYYNRVHIVPDSLNVGNLLSTQTRPVEVWNAHRSTKLLSGISQSGTDGMTLIEPYAAPTTFGVFESRTYTLQVGTAGSPVIDAAYVFAFPGEQVRLSVMGRRVLVWPFIPQTTHRESLEWKTDVIKSFSTEQRLALRSEARQAFSYTYMLTPEEFSKAKAISSQWAHRVYGVPVWSELSHVGPLPMGTTFLPVDTTVADYRENDVVIIWESSSKELAVEITTVQPGSVTLKLPLTVDFTNAYVAPLRFARAYSGIDYTRAGNDVVVSKATFSVTQNKHLGASIGYPQHRGKDVVTDRTIVVGDVTERISRTIDVFDNGSGPVEVDITSNWVDHHQVLTFSTKNRVERWRARKWLHSLQGKQKAFWLPSWNRDLEVTADFNSTSSGLVVKAINYPVLYGVKDIMIQLKSGTRIFKRVLSGTANNDGTETLSLDATIGVTATVNDIDMVCFISHVRLDSDTVELNHEYNGQISVSISVVEVPE